MQIIDSGLCRTSSGTGQTGATQGSGGFQGSLQDRADQFVRSTVLSDLGQSVGHGRHARGIQGVANAVAQALSGQDVTGTDAADDVLKKIETSLHKAAQAMADRGIDGKTIDATIDRFRAQLAGALDGMVKSATGAGGTSGSSDSGSSDSGSSSSGVVSGSSGSTSSSGGSTSAPAPATSVTSVSQFVAREVRKERSAIDLVTAEGDRVSIRFRSKEVVTGSVTQATSSDGTTTTAAKSSVFSRGGVKIEVDGNLNEDELKAIGDLLGKVDDIATKFFSGDVQAAFSAAGSLGVDSDQIAAYRVNLTYSRKVATAYGAWGVSTPASTQPPATTGDGTATAGSASGSTSSGSESSASGSASNTSSTSGAGSSSSVDGSATASTDGSSSASGSGASAGDSASGTGASAGAAGSDAGNTTADGTAGSATDSGATDGTTTTGSSDTPPATTPPASAQKTIIDFINDALSKLGSANGAGRLTFSTHWKMSVLITAIQSTQPAQPTTATDQAAANNTQLLGDSLQKIAFA